jgi:hypothetical protein
MMYGVEPAPHHRLLMSRLMPARMSPLLEFE